MGYIVVKDFHVRTKISNSLYLEDLLFVISYPFFLWMLFDGIVSDRLTVLYILFNAAVALWLVQRPKSNPGKKRFQVLLFMLRQDLTTYHVIPPFERNGKEDRHGG